VDGGRLGTSLRPRERFFLISTSTPYFVPRGTNPTQIRVGKDYFLIQIHGAQVAFKGSIWQRVKNLVVAQCLPRDLTSAGIGS
jgi:hypothetical protein